MFKETQRVRDWDKDPDLEKGEKSTQRQRTPKRHMEQNRPRVKGESKSESEKKLCFNIKISQYDLTLFINT